MKISPLHTSIKHGIVINIAHRKLSQFCGREKKKKKVRESRSNWPLTSTTVETRKIQFPPQHRNHLT